MSPLRFSPFRASVPVFACAAVLAFASAGAGTLRAKDDVPAGLLNNEMPRGTILESASCAETVFATRQAVRKHPDQAVPILKCAINSRVAPGGQPTRRGVTRAHDDKDVVVPCECLTRIVQAALQAAPDGKAHELIETAMAMQPQCSTEIAALLRKPGIDFKDGPAVASNDPANGRRAGRGGSGDGLNGAPGTGFGDGLLGGDANGLGYGGFGTGGFGSGFPGSPGFIGSAPGGTNAFPPVVIGPVTSVVNQ